MASPKSIKAASPVAPGAPEKAKDADTAQAGQVSEAKFTAKERPKPKPGKKDPEKKSWIEIQLVDQNGKGIPGESWEITAPDGSGFSGTTDEDGVGRLEGIDSGSCQITFPRLDKDAWEKA